MTVIEQVMFFAACQECDWQSVLRSEAAVVEGMERTHRSHEHGSSEQEFLSHYAADVTVPQPSEPEPCDHGSYWTDHDGRDHCLVCPHVSQPSEPVCPHHESAGSCPVFGCPHHQPDGSQS